MINWLNQLPHLSCRFCDTNLCCNNRKSNNNNNHHHHSYLPSSSSFLLLLRCSHGSCSFSVSPGSDSGCSSADRVETNRYEVCQRLQSLWWNIAITPKHFFISSCNIWYWNVCFYICVSLCDSRKHYLHEKYKIFTLDICRRSLIGPNFNLSHHCTNKIILLFMFSGAFSQKVPSHVNLLKCLRNVCIINAC